VRGRQSGCGHGYSLPHHPGSKAPQNSGISKNFWTEGHKLPR
jgi:hypothetical protein